MLADNTAMMSTAGAATKAMATATTPAINCQHAIITAAAT